MPETLITIEAENDPVIWAAAAARHEMFERNWAWLESNATDVYSHRGEFICVAGQELFVGDSVDDVNRAATAAHPETGGVLRDIFRSKTTRESMRLLSKGERYTA